MRKILLVDDDPSLVEALADLLENASTVQCLPLRDMNSVVQHESEILARGPDGTPAFELAILDINLGSGEPSGIEVYQWLCDHGFGGRVVFLTGHGKNHPQVREAYEISGAKVFEKPQDINKLLSWVEAK